MSTQYLDDNGDPIQEDPVAGAKKFLAQPDTYVDDNGDPIKSPATAPSKPNLIDKLLEFGDKAATSYLPTKYQPSTIISKFTEPLKRYGESGTDLLHKAALYGGTFADSLANTAENSTSPIQLGLMAATGGAGIADEAGLSKVADALRTPGKVAGGLMMGHGAAKAYNDPNYSDKAAGVAEAVLGYLGARGEGESKSTPKSEDLPAEVPDKVIKAENRPASKTAFDTPDSAEKARLQELASKGDNLTINELKEAQSLNRKLKSLAKTKDEISKFAPKPDNSNTNIPQQQSQFSNTAPKPRVKPAYDGAGRLVGYETISDERPSQFDVNKTIDTGTPQYLDENTGEPVREPQAVVLNDQIRNEPVSDEQMSRFTPNADNKPQYVDENTGEPVAANSEVINKFPHEQVPFEGELSPQLKSIFNEPSEFNDLKTGDDVRAYGRDMQPTNPQVINSEQTPTATYNSFQPDESHPEGGFHQYDVQGGPLDKSTVSAQTLQENGITVPETPNTASKIPAPIKAILDANKIDSSQMDVQTAVNKARELNGQNSVGNATNTGSMDTSNNPAQNGVQPLDPISKLKNALQSSNEARPAQDVINANERATRAGKLAGNSTPGYAGHLERQALLKGEFPKIPVESQLTHDDLNQLLDTVKSSELKPYEIQNAGNGIVKLVSGKQVTPYESKLLGKVFGPDLDELIHLHGGLGATPIKNFVHESVNLPKTMMATADLSAPLRQGLPLIATKEYWNSFKSMIRSEADYNSLKEGLAERPKAEFGNRAGLYLADTVGELEGREEQFLSNQVDKVPVFGALKKASERAYTGFLNKLRADTFDNLIDKADAAGNKTYDLVKNAAGEVEKHPNKLARDIATFVNNSTGRGSLGRFEKNAVELNAALFSPRLIASRLTMLNPKYYMDLEPFARKQALKALFSVAGAGLITTSLLKKAGATVSTDPYNTDFGKAKIGNIRLDPFGGFQQPIVAAARLLGGKEDSVNGTSYDLNHSKFPNPTRLDVVTNFARSKESPVAKFADDLLLGDQAFKPSGLGAKIAKTDIGARAVNDFTPMLINDMIDLKKENPDLIPGVTLAALATFGDSLQTMNPPKPKSAFRLNFNAKLKP